VGSVPNLNLHPGSCQIFSGVTDARFNEDAFPSNKKPTNDQILGTITRDFTAAFVHKPPIYTLSATAQPHNAKTYTGQYPRTFVSFNPFLIGIKNASTSAVLILNT
jgi:hypothetical protein